MHSVSVNGNRCFDDNTPTEVTQRHALDLNNSGTGEFNNISIANSNDMKGYNSSGNVETTDILRQGTNSDTVNATALPITKNFADLDKMTVSNGTEKLILEIFISNSSTYIRLLLNNTSTTTLDDPDGILRTSDSGVGIAVYNDSGKMSIKNRLGQTRNISFWVGKIIKF